MTQLAGALFGSLFGAGEGVITTLAPAAGAATTATGLGSALSIGSILKGALTIGSMISSINAGNARAEEATLAAQDAEAQKPLETLQGIDRRTSIKQALAETVGNIDTSYAASGTDLSFGSPSEARAQAFRKADSAISTETGTEQIRTGRLDERAANYKRKADNARASGYLDAGMTGIKLLAGL